MRFLVANGSVIANCCAVAVALSTLLNSSEVPSEPFLRPRLAATPLSRSIDQNGAAKASTTEMDRVDFFNRNHCEGLIESEDADFLNLIRIIRQPGKPMHLVIQPIDRREIASVDRLDDDKRASLKQAIEQFRNRTVIESMRMDAVKLEPRSVGGLGFLHYQGKWFQLDSTANDSITRMVVVRAEQIFAAYRQIIAPRTHPAAPPRLVLFASFNAYQNYLKSLGLKIENQGCFLEDKNVVVIGSELTHASSILSMALKRNADFRSQLEALKKRLDLRMQTIAQQYKQQGLAKAEIDRAIVTERSNFDKQLRKGRDELHKSDLEVARLFKEQMGQTFVRLYHESFHAYLRNYVYPRDKYDVPLWLNEGLAVIFQGGVLEGNSLRVDAPNPEFLKLLKTELAAGRAMPLAELLEAKESDFLATDATLPAEVNRHYANAWGVAYSLVFDGQLFPSKALEQYVQLSAKSQPAIKRFERLVGQPLEQFQGKWQEEVRRR